MNHWIIAPVILPALLAPFIVLVMRHDLSLQRVFSTAATAALWASMRQRTQTEAVESGLDVQREVALK